MFYLLECLGKRQEESKTETEETNRERNLTERPRKDAGGDLRQNLRFKSTKIGKSAANCPHGQHKQTHTHACKARRDKAASSTEGSHDLGLKTFGSTVCETPLHVTRQTGESGMQRMHAPGICRQRENYVSKYI